MDQRSPHIFIITGHPGSGKTTFLEKLVETLRKKGYTVTGFLAPASSKDFQERSYEIQNIETDETFDLASSKAHPGWDKTGKFFFNPEAIHLGIKILQNPLIIDYDLIVVDEIGPFELDNKIWADSISKLLSYPDLTMIWIVRKNLLQDVIRKWNLKNTYIIDVGIITVPEAKNKILSKLSSL